MNEFSTYEYVVAEKKGKKLAMKKFALIVGYAVFVVAWFVFGFATNLFPLLALIPITLWILVWFTWKYVNIEYEYSMTSGVATFSRIYGGRKRKQLIEFKLKDCTAIEPLDGADAKIEAFAPEDAVVALSAADTPDAYVALVTPEGGKRTAIYFEATEKALKICRFYNSASTVVTKVRY